MPDPNFSAVPAAASAPGASDDQERRFGGLRRLFGPDANAKLSQAHVMVAGLGGVGSWTAEALARCGVGKITLADLDHIAPSNINRQIHALDHTLGQAKIEAMADRIRGINPQCHISLVDDFVSTENVAEVVPGDALLIDATDQVSAKLAMILLCRSRQQALLVCGGAGGKTDPYRLQAGDLSQATNDPLLARIRHELRRHHGYPRGGQSGGKALKRVPRMGIRVLWLNQPARPPLDDEGCAIDGSPQGLSCAGYGSLITVTAAMGLAAAHEALQLILASPVAVG